jgi:outer membrane protein OmpA-like peptidoglycan-associated protein
MAKWLFVLIGGVFWNTSAVAGDIAGSADLPGIGRFEGSEIVSYRFENYGETVFATGAVKGASRDAISKRAEGQITRIVYKVPKGSSVLEVFRNIEQRIQEAGFELGFSGRQDSYAFISQKPTEIMVQFQLGASGSVFSAYGTALEGGAEKHIGLAVTSHMNGQILVQLITAVTKAMENRMVDAAAMQEAIATKGHIALYGIYFDTDSDAVKAKSEPTISEIARFLSENSSVNVIVVGHTDNQGSLEYNLDLSKRRAASVTRSLTTNHGIASGRIRSEGVGYLAPVATNDSEDGRALNRRVELVKEN